MRTELQQTCMNSAADRSRASAPHIPDLRTNCTKAKRSRKLLWLRIFHAEQSGTFESVARNSGGYGVTSLKRLYREASGLD